MATLTQVPDWIERSERRVLKLGTRTALVKYKTPETGTLRTKIAQIADISLSGAQIISRLPMDAAIGSLVNLEFTLPGVQRRLFQKACVTRKINAFAFAVCFIRGGGEPSVVQQAIDEFDFARGRPTTLRRILPATPSWYQTHQQGLKIFAAALLFAILALAYAPKRSSNRATILKLSSQGVFQGWDIKNTGGP